MNGPPATREAGRRGPHDLLSQALHRSAPADEDGLLVERGPQALVLRAELVARERVRNRDQDALALRRLLEEVDGPAARGLDGCGDVAVTRDHQDGRRRFARHDLVEHLETVHAGHLDVEQDRVGRGRVQVREGGLPVGSGRDLVPFVLEDHAEGVADARIVVDDQDLLAHPDLSMQRARLLFPASPKTSTPAGWRACEKCSGTRFTARS